MMRPHDSGPTPGAVWSYGYEILPALPQSRLRSLEAILHKEHRIAKRNKRKWTGRFVVEEQVTHLLVVSDTSDQQLEVNRRVETELKKLAAAYSITSPVEITDPNQRGLFTDGDPGSTT
jgi:hypothetical protein